MNAITTYDISDDYEHLGDDLEYILENVLSEEIVYKTNDGDNDYQKLKDLFNTLLINKCQCDGTAECSTNCSHGGNYTFDENTKELILNPQNKNGDLIYECTTLCKCKTEICLNRLVQYGPRKHLKIVDSIKYHSKGMITTQRIPKGAFVCEYAGELVTRRQAKKILHANELKHRMNYVLCLREMGKTDNPMIMGADDSKAILTIVDPSSKGNIGRYLNHSCQPNCQIFSVRIDCPIPKIGKYRREHFLVSVELNCFVF